MTGMIVHVTKEELQQLIETSKADFLDYHKFRVGDYRILCKVLEDKKFLQIHAIGHRSEIYRKR